MKILALSRYALGICASVAFLAACSSGGSQPTPELASQAPLGGNTPERSNVANNYLYALIWDCAAPHPSHVDCVIEYAPGSSTPVRTIESGIDVPIGIAFDSHSNLYVTNWYKGISVYAPGKTRDGLIYSGAVL